MDLQINKDYLGAVESLQGLYQTEKKAADSYSSQAQEGLAAAEQAKSDIARWKDEADDVQKALAEALWNVAYYKQLYTLQEQENWYLKKRIVKMQERIDEQALEISTLKKRIEQLQATIQQLTTKEARNV